MNTKTILSSIAKLAICGATIFAIAWGFVTLEPSGEVQESEADVWDLSIFPRSSTQKFASALEHLGHEKPRSYDVNGNKIFFSARATDKRPTELVEEYQRAFYDQNLNEELHGKTLKPTKAARRLMSGQVIPLDISRDRVVMGGGVVEGSPVSEAEWEEVKPKVRDMEFHDAFKGFRHIEAAWNKKAGRTFVTAVWSDEEFDMRKISGANLEGNEADPNIPACVGCLRTIRWTTDDRDIPNTVNIFVSPQDPQTVAGFYKDALGRRGWALAGSSEPTQHRRGTLFDFARGDERIELTVSPERGGGSKVAAMHVAND